MRKILFNLIIIIALLGNINIAEAQYAHPATAIKSANGNVQNDLNTLQANIASNTQEVALITSEIEAINQNLATHEAELASITAEINLMSVNLGTIEIRLDSIETNILSMIEPAITELRLNLSTIEDLINSNYNSLFANLGTHETLINDNFLTLHTNIGTLEAKLVADKAELFNNISTLETALRDNLTTLEAKLVADKLELYTNIGTLEAKLTADKIELYNNLLTHEVSINSILLNLSTHETLITDNFNTLYANLQTHEAELAAITNEIELIHNNLATHESLITNNFNTLLNNLGTLELKLNNDIAALIANLQTHEIELANITSEILAIRNNLDTHETLINQNYLTLSTNISTLEALVNANYNSLFTNIETLELKLNNDISAILANLQTHETLLASITGEISLIFANLDTMETRLDSIEANILSMIQPAVDSLFNNIETLEALVIDNFNTLYANLQTHEIELAAITNEINLLNINLGTVEDRLNGFTLNFNTIEIELGSISVAINNLDLQLGIIELALSGGISGEVFTRTSNGFTWATPASGVTDHLLLSNIGTKTHLELEQDILDLQANPAGISRVYIDGVALATGEVEFIAGANISLNVIGNTVEIESSGGGQTAEVNFVEKLNYSTREQGTAAVGLFSIYKFNLPVSGTVLNSISCYLNGLKQDKGAGLDYIVDTWDNGGVSSYKVVFNKDLDENDLVAISYFINNTVIVGSAFEEVASYISDNTIWEATTTYDYSSTAVYRNGLKQNKSSYTMPTVAAKSRIVFNSAINVTDEVIITGVAGSGSAEDIATYISDNTIWDFNSDYNSLEVYIYRNGVYQARSKFATSSVSDKLRVTFGSAINTTDEISLIHIQ